MIFECPLQLECEAREGGGALEVADSVEVRLCTLLGEAVRCKANTARGLVKLGRLSRWSGAGCGAAEVELASTADPCKAGQREGQEEGQEEGQTSGLPPGCTATCTAESNIVR